MIETGIFFGDIHSFFDLNLILSAVNIPPAQPKTNYVEIPGGDTSIDLTEALGGVHFHDRECKFTFSVNPADDKTFEERRMIVANALNGKRCNICLDKDPDYYYSGRITINEWLQDRNLKQFVIGARVAPYKYRRNETVVSVTLSNTPQKVILVNGRKKVVPVITCTGNTTIVFGSATFNVSAGTHIMPDICLTEGANPVMVSGTGTVTFTYREGDF